MKKQISFALLAACVISSQAHAVPVMNENSSVSQNTTIFPDHADPNVFYIAPNVISLCLDQDNTPRFSYQDWNTRAGTNGIVQMTLCARYHDAELAAAKADLLSKHPAARFIALPFTASRISFDTVLAPLILKDFCSHTAGMVGDEQSCSFRLGPQGRRVFLKQVRSRLALTMQYYYSVAGFIRLPSGAFAPFASDFGIAVRVGGEELKNHPELFVDANGRTIKVPVDFPSRK